MLRKLSYKGKEIEVIIDQNIYMMFEKRSRGGICIENMRFLKKKKNKHILYIDANNLYGFAMIQYLFDNNYKWFNKQEINDFTIEKILSIPKNSLISYIFVINASFPKEIHDFLSNLPLAAENRSFDNSEFIDKLAERCNKKKKKNEPKLTPNLCKKEKYVIHYRNLQFYIKLGMKVDKIHKICEFTQFPWLKPYINELASLRKNTNNEVDKNLYKLCAKAFNECKETH